MAGAKEKELLRPRKKLIPHAKTHCHHGTGVLGRGPTLADLVGFSGNGHDTVEAVAFVVVKM